MNTMEMAKAAFANRHAADAWFTDAEKNFELFAEMLRNESGWQPIETAPKDDTVIDIFSPKVGRCVCMRRVDYGDNNIFYEQTNGGYQCVRSATHWLPISVPRNEAD